MVDRQRYWKLEPDEVAKFGYNESKMLNWDIKCTKEDGVSFVGAFAYRNGIPVEYESVKGVGFYHNQIDDKQRDAVSEMLKKKFGGSVENISSNRTLLRESNAPYSGKDVGELALELESLIDGHSVITLEFEGLTQDEQDSSGLPSTKLLPIPGARDGA